MAVKPAGAGTVDVPELFVTVVLAVEVAVTDEVPVIVDIAVSTEGSYQSLLKSCECCILTCQRRSYGICYGGSCNCRCRNSRCSHCCGDCLRGDCREWSRSNLYVFGKSESEGVGGGRHGIDGFGANFGGTDLLRCGCNKSVEEYEQCQKHN